MLTVKVYWPFRSAVMFSKSTRFFRVISPVVEFTAKDPPELSSLAAMLYVSYGEGK